MIDSYIQASETKVKLGLPLASNFRARIIRATHTPVDTIDVRRDHSVLIDLWRFWLHDHIGDLLNRFHGIRLAKARITVYGSIRLPPAQSEACIRGTAHVARTEDRPCCSRRRAGRHLRCRVRSRKTVSFNPLRA